MGDNLVPNGLSIRSDEATAVSPVPSRLRLAGWLAVPVASAPAGDRLLFRCTRYTRRRARSGGLEGQPAKSLACAAAVGSPLQRRREELQQYNVRSPSSVTGLT